MANHGSSLTALPDLQKGWGSAGTVSFTTYAGRICLVSFIDIDTGWSWLQQLKNMYDDSDTNFGYAGLNPSINIVAVVFRYNGTTDRPEVSGKVGGDSTLNSLVDNSNFLILVDPDWNAAGPTSPSKDNSGDFGGVLATGTSNFYWSYLIGRNSATVGNQNAVSDKWEYRTTSLPRPVAFSKIVLEAGGQIVTAINETTGGFTLMTPPAAPLGFDSTLEHNTRAFAIQRMKNLVDLPRILSTDLPDGAWVNDPADLTTVHVWFSKPMNHLQASTALKYNLSGGGIGSSPPLAISVAAYAQLGNALNEADLTLIGNIKDSAVDKSIVLSGNNISDTYGGAPNPANPMDKQTTYQVDVTAPTVVSVSATTPDGTCAANAVIDITVQFLENVLVVTTGGTPSLALNSGGTATYYGGSGGSVLTFRYRVAAGENSADLDYVAANSLALNGGTIGDAAGNDADRTLPPPGGVGSLGANKNIVIQTTPPQNIVLVLDYSGTMDQTVAFGDPPGPSKSKVQWVKDAVNDFANYLLDQVASSNYRVGIVLYSTDGLKAMDLTDKSTLLGNRNLIPNALALVPTREMTAMGKGLAWALSMLTYTVPQATYPGFRAIVQLADGQQNIQPYVLPVENNAGHAGMDEFTINTALATSGCPAGMGTIDVATGDISIHTLGIGGTPAWFATLAQISEVTNASHHTNDQVWPATISAFISLLPSLFPYSSPQIVRNGKESFQSGGSNIFSFELDSSVNKITICLSWAGSAPLACSLKKANQSICLDSVVQKEGLFIGTVRLPHYQPANGSVLPHRFSIENRFADAMNRNVVILDTPLFDIAGKAFSGKKLPLEYRGNVVARGSWQVEVTKTQNGAMPPSGYPYLLAILVDEKEVKYRIDPVRFVYWAGEAIPLGMKLMKNGIPIDVAPRIEVNVTRPLVPLNNLLGNDPKLASTVLQGHMPTNLADVPKKMDQIMHDKIVMPMLEKRQTAIVRLGSVFGLLRRARAKSGRGLSSFYSDTRTSGAYNLGFQIRANQGKNGIYQRLAFQTVLILPRPELAYSTLEGKLNGGVLSIVFTPKDRFSNFLGPGVGDDFFIEVEKLKVSKVTDQLNGTYVLEVPVSGVTSATPDIAKLKQKVFNALMRKYFARVGVK